MSHRVTGDWSRRRLRNSWSMAALVAFLFDTPRRHLYLDSMSQRGLARAVQPGQVPPGKNKMSATRKSNGRIGSIADPYKLWICAAALQAEAVIFFPLAHAARARARDAAPALQAGSSFARYQ